VAPARNPFNVSGWRFTPAAPDERGLTLSPSDRQRELRLLDQNLSVAGFKGYRLVRASRFAPARTEPRRRQLSPPSLLLLLPLSLLYIPSTREIDVLEREREFGVPKPSSAPAAVDSRPAPSPPRADALARRRHLRSGVRRGTWFHEVTIREDLPHPLADPRFAAVEGQARIGFATALAELQVGSLPESVCKAATSARVGAASLFLTAVHNRARPVQGPVGYDRFGYALCSQSGEVSHLRRRAPYGAPLRKGDVVGCLIHLPLSAEEVGPASGSQHRGPPARPAAARSPRAGARAAGGVGRRHACAEYPAGPAGPRAAQDAAAAASGAPPPPPRAPCAARAGATPRRRARVGARWARGGGRAGLTRGLDRAARGR